MTIEPRVVVSWKGENRPIMLTFYGPAGELAIPLSPTRALELAKELIEPAVQRIKIDRWGPDWSG